MRFHTEVLGITGKNEGFPKNMGDTIIFRRWLPFGASSGHSNQNRPKVDVVEHTIQEGVTPTIDGIKPVDVTVQIQQYGCVYGYTDKVSDLYEDNIPMEQKVQCGERIGLLREMLKYGALKGCANRQYANSVASRSAVVAGPSINDFRKIARTLLANHAKQITRILAPSVNISTESVEAGWLVFFSHRLRGEHSRPQRLHPCFRLRIKEAGA